MDKMKGNHGKADSKGTVPANIPSAAPSNNSTTAEKTKVSFDKKDAVHGDHKNGDFSN